MKLWHSLSRKFTRRPPTKLEASLALTLAYRRVFLTNQSSEQDRQMVLADMALRSGLSTITPPEASSEVLRHNEGKREHFAVTRGHLNLSQDDIDALENAVKYEMAMIYQQQQT